MMYKPRSQEFTWLAQEVLAHPWRCRVTPQPMMTERAFSQELWDETPGAVSRSRSTSTRLTPPPQ
jgi:hypothetical protein